MTAAGAMPHPAVTTVVLAAVTLLMLGAFGCLLGRVRARIKSRPPAPSARPRERAVAEVVDRCPFDNDPLLFDPPPGEIQ